jgi:hypothetical protein
VPVDISRVLESWRCSLGALLSPFVDSLIAIGLHRLLKENEIVVGHMFQGNPIRKYCRVSCMIASGSASIGMVGMPAIVAGYVRWDNRGMPEEKLRSTFDWTVAKGLPRNLEKFSKRLQKAVTGRAKPGAPVAENSGQLGRVAKVGIGFLD